MVSRVRSLTVLLCVLIMPGLVWAQNARQVKDSRQGDSSVLPEYTICADASLPEGISSGSWRHTRSSILASTGKARHTAEDAIANPDSTASLSAKFAYGVASKDLEDEEIDIWLADCSGTYRRVGRAITDHDGRIEFTLSAEDVPSVGFYSVYYRVRADGTGVEGALRVLPEKTRFVVFDIDETLSAGGTMRTIWDVMRGSTSERPRPGAVETARARYQQGYQLVYLTARPYVVTKHTREWLLGYGFPPGTLQLVQDTSKTAISRSGRAEYKYNYLVELLEKGGEIEHAYGNAESDLAAYLKLGLHPSNIYILGEHGGREGTTDLGLSFESHLEKLDPEPVDQPYRRPGDQEGVAH